MLCDWPPVAYFVPVVFVDALNVIILGIYCQVNVDDCQPNPCRNGGLCIDRINSFYCNCTEDWMGVVCEKPYDVCELQPCQVCPCSLSNIQLENYWHFRITLHAIRSTSATLLVAVCPVSKDPNAKQTKTIARELRVLEDK